MPDNHLKEHFGLTAGEEEILAVLARGFTDEEIAVELSLSQAAVHSRLHRFYDRTGISGPRRVVAWAKDHLHCCIRAT